MSEDVWSERDTTPDRIETALRELLRERHRANHTLAPARVLNLVVIVDRAWKGEVANRLDRVGRYHASRTVLCAVEEGREQLDAVAVMSFEEKTEAGIVAMHEKVEIDVGPQHLVGIETIVDPVIVSELPTMLWSPHGYDEAVQELRPLIDVMLLDSDDDDEPVEGLAKAHDMAQSAYVVDLAWLRTTPWRERLAASFDPPDRLLNLRSLDALSVRHRASSRASALLLGGWLASRLHWEPAPLHAQDGMIHGSAQGREGPVALELDAVEQESPGLAGVSVACAGGFKLSLDRGRGGLVACEQEPGGEARKWQVLGASRGEGGILGEGVRQALLRDPTYGPALYAARRFADGI